MRRSFAFGDYSTLMEKCNRIKLFPEKLIERGSPYDHF